MFIRIAFFLIALLPGVGRLAACELAAAYTTPEVERLLGGNPDKGLPPLHQRLGELSGCTLRMGDYPNPRIWYMFQRGELTLVLGAIASPERNKAGLFYRMYHGNLLWVTRRGSPVASGPAALGSGRLGVLRGTQSTPELLALQAKLAPSGQLDYSTGWGMLLKKLEKDRIAATTFVPEIYQSIGPELRANFDARPAPELGLIEAGVYLNPARLPAAERQRLDAALQQMIRERYITRLMQAARPATASQPTPAARQK
ncbi:hypothetical protein [Chitinilyticum aquatile]|uniref:hypothetical protein n=1 Tax=Chitinilyticum aquatile TaxID=362520 RepID=UPI000418B60E|nr:hypothetical protein [Chitinilyticum aquatile]